MTVDRNRSFLSALLASAALIGGIHGVMAADLTLKNITLSTSGLAQFDWSGDVTSGSDTLSLPVRRNQVDDILKSLVVLDNSGTINSVSLAGQESLKQLFTDLPFSQADLAHPANLLDSLKGQKVTVEGQEKASGRLMSIHKRPTLDKNGDTLTHDYILTLMGDNGMQEVTLNNLNTVKFLDPSLNKDLERALSAVQEQSKQDTRTVTVTVSGDAARKVGLSYVVDAPLWKAAYRIILPKKDTDTAFVQGWAVLENTTGGDWDNVNLSLVSGNPVTYRQNLYDSFYVDRPILPVEVFGKVMPRKDTGAFDTAETMPPSPVMEEMAQFGGANDAMIQTAPHMKTMARGMMADEMAAAPMMAKQSLSMAGGGNVALSTEAAGQMVFHFPQAVSLQSGYSMMVPFINADVKAEKIYLYQSDVNAQHPLASLSLTNDGKTGLPPGIVTLYSPDSATGNTYIGDAQMPLVNAGDSRMLSFAVDGKTAIKTDYQDDNRTTDITIAGGIMKVTQAMENTATYTVKAPKDEDRTVIIEHPKRGGDWKLVTPKNDVTETDTHYRVKTSVKAGGQVDVPVTLEYITFQSLQVADIHSQNLNHYIQSWKEITPDAKKVFARLFQLRGLVDDFDTQIQNLNQSKQRIVDDQKRIRENLGAVSVNSDLAKRYMGQLEKEEDTLDDIAAKLEDLQAKRTDAMKRLKDYIINVKI